MTTVRIPVVPRALRWATVALIAGVIFYNSILNAPSQTVVPNPVPPDLLDKWRHFLAYGALAGSLWYATLDLEQPIQYIILLVLGTSIIYGIGIECWQAMIPNRYFSMIDVYANVLGSLFVVPLLALRGRMEIWKIP